MKFAKNREKPRSKPLTSPSREGKRITVEINPPPTQVKARSKSNFGYGGSVNKDE
jgi:hypothetical protein